MITLKNLSVGYSAEIISNINAEINNGEIVCLIGRNGSGKTTLIKTITGQKKEKRGEIFIDDTKTSQLTEKDISQKISVLFTEKVNIKNITVKEMVGFGRYPFCGNNCLFSDKDKKIVTEYIEKTSLSRKENHFFDTLSDGEKQRTMIAKTLAQDTPHILLDEPTSHLDLPAKIQMLSLIKNWVKTQQRCALLSLHEPELALKIADRIWFLHNQKMICGTPSEIVQTQFFKEDFLCQHISFDSENLTFNIDL